MWRPIRWFRFWTHHYEHRRRHAYFRPTETSNLDATLAGLVDSLVIVRFADVARADNPCAGQRFYAIHVEGTAALTFLRPECDFDFLE
jgi:hypothetical protein